MATVLVERDVPIEMRDGVVLRGDVYRPSGGGPYPTLLQRIPYNKSAARAAAGLILNPLIAADRGYAVVIQDTRGGFTSGGKWVPFFSEADDGYDTVEWCARQPWCNGKVGVYGSSYMGVTTWQAVASAPPHLEAGFAYLTGSNYHKGWTYTGGAFELGFNLWWALSLAASRLDRLPPEQVAQARGRLLEAMANPMEAYRFLPLSELPALKDGVAPYYFDWLNHSSYDEYWSAVNVGERHDRVSVPVLQMTGWFDNFLVGHLENYVGIKEKGATEKARRYQKLVIGPWAHENYMGSTPTKVGDIDFGPSANPAAEVLAFRWFDHWLKGEFTGIADEAPVRVFVTGANVWRDEQEWPLARAREARFYLHSHGRANTLYGDGVLTTTQPGMEAPDAYVYDPADPVPTVGGRAMFSGVARGGILDQRAVEERGDVLVYTSQFLATDTEVTGPLAVKLWASTSGRDTDFTAKLIDVYPDGYAAILCDGIIRGRFRESMSRPALLEPGKAYEFTIDLWAISHVFKAGHRIRVEITSSNFPRFDRNLNTGLGPIDGTLQKAVQTIYHDAEHPSCIMLPVIPS